ncbi:MAG TPA: TonB family protein [Pyrinomonadaceae bacterium]|nr:TonB family protein [Pyrinomonadaceae bacterium]
MFDELVETQPTATEAKGRKSYFVGATLVLSITLFAALIVSIFAVDLDVDINEMDMLSIVAPIDTPVEQKRPELESAPKDKPKVEAAPSGAQRITVRQDTVARLDESPTTVPTTVATTATSAKERPVTGNYVIGDFDFDGANTGKVARGPGGTGTEGDGLGGDTMVAKVEEEPAQPAPPPVVKPAPKRSLVQTMGVINGRATSLPMPTIPPAAKVANVAGTVAVQVLVDENGNVISANAVSGSQLLRASSEAAARRAKFNATTVDGTPVRVSGVINYNFS